MKPKVYSAYLTVRFSDLDMYGHVNVSKYLDYVVTSRWFYAQNELNMSAHDFMKRGMGIYITKAETLFLRAINGLQEMYVSSQIREITELGMIIDYAIQSKDESKTFAKGFLEQRFIDLSTNKGTPFPEWAKPYFYDEV